MIGSLNLSQTQWARNVVQVSAAVSGEERCVTRQITAAWETIKQSKRHDLHLKSDYIVRQTIIYLLLLYLPR